MARSFTPNEARALTAQHQELLSRLETIAGSPEQFRQDVARCAQEMATAVVWGILREVPVESLNVNKEGFKTKLLRDSGFATVGDLWTADPNALAGIKGISLEAAVTMKRRADDYARQAQTAAKIRLSADDRSREATKLVYYLAICRVLLPLTDTARALWSQAASPVTAALADLSPALRRLGWVFTAREVKDRAERAYAYLIRELHSGYGPAARQLFQGVEQALHQTAEQAWDAFQRDPAGFVGLLEQIAPGVLGNGDLLYGLPEDLAHGVSQEPLHLEGLKCTLRRYQEWGVKYILHQKRVLLGDEMGLGKTVQAIGAMVSLRNDGASHFLVVCPASLLRNWCKEVQKHSDLSVTEIYGPDKDREFALWRDRGGVAVTTYETTGWLQPLVREASFPLALLTVDEAHYIKNPGAQRTAHVTALCGRAQRLLFMTGTALENRAEEMVSLIRVLQPELAGEAGGLAFMASAPQFREKVAPVYYRRRREDVLTELPELIQSPEWCRLGPEEEAVYEEAVLSRNFAEARRVSWNVPDLSHSVKARRLQEIVEEAEADGRKVLVFSFFLDTLSAVCSLLGPRCAAPLTGAVPPGRRQEIVDQFEAAGPGAVLPAQIQTGGTGLNIQAASVVVLCEPQLKPSTENQAVSRAYRMGQGRNVLVFRLLCENTIDERLLELLAQKQDIFNAFADRSQAAEDQQEAELDEAGLGELIQQEIQRITQKRQAALPPAPEPET